MRLTAPPCCLMVVAVWASTACGVDSDVSAPPRESTTSATIADQETVPEELVQDAAFAGPALASASATAADTFDPAFYESDAGSFPALDDPVMVPAMEVDWLSPDDIVMGIFTDTESRAFPVDQMAFHHVANTRLADEPFVVTY